VARPRATTVDDYAVDLYWLPLGAGGHSVRLNGRVSTALDGRRGHRTAARQARARCPDCSLGQGWAANGWDVELQLRDLLAARYERSAHRVDRTTRARSRSRLESRARSRTPH